MLCKPDSNAQPPGVPNWVVGVKPQVRRLEPPEPAVCGNLLQLALFQQPPTLNQGMIYTAITVARNTSREGTVMAKYDVAIRSGRDVSETAPIAGFDQGKAFPHKNPKGLVGATGYRCTLP